MSAVKCVAPLSFFAVVFLCILLHSCAFVSFAKFSVTSNVDGQNVSLLSEWLELRFSDNPDQRQAETLISLFLDGKTLEPEFRWNGTCLSLRPQTGWKNGGFYSLLLDGKIALADGRMYEAYLNEYFYYKGNSSFLQLSSVIPSSDSFLEANQPLVFTFNKEIDVNSFYQSFNLTPQRDYSAAFSADGTAVTVTAKNGWENNRRYVWRLSNLAAQDAFYLEYSREGSFYTASDIDFPRLTEVCPVKPGNPPHYFGQDIRDSPPPLFGDEAFALVFSKDMDFSSLSRSITIDPALKHYLLPDPTFKDRILFVPQEHYAADRYSLTISSSATDISGLSPVGDITVFFSAAYEPLCISTLSLDALPTVSGAEEIERLSRERQVTDHTLLLLDRLDSTFRFSSAFTAKARSEALTHISFTPLFPASARVPSAVCASWDPVSPSSFTVTWNNVTAADSGNALDYYYQIKIRGGKNGITNGYGSYLTEDICIIVRLFI